MHRGFLLAAGLGTRLWPLSDVRAKPAFPYRGRTLIDHVLELMRQHHVREYYANTHHLPNTIADAVAAFEARHNEAVNLVNEPVILGTGGALVNLKAIFESVGALVMNAKVVTDIDLTAALQAHRQSGAAVTMVCVPNRQREKFTHVDADTGGSLRGFVPADRFADIDELWTFTGIQVLSPEFFHDLPAPGFSDTIKDIYPRLQARGKLIHVHRSEARWNEFSTLARYRDLCVQNAPGGNDVDASCVIDPHAAVHRSVLWPGARIAKDCHVTGCIVADGVQLPPGSVWENMAIIQATRVRSSAPPSAHEKNQSFERDGLLAVRIS